MNEPELVQMLVERRGHIYNQMEATATTEVLHALVGEARQLTSLIRLINESRESSERLEQHRKARHGNTDHIGF